MKPIDDDDDEHDDGDDGDNGNDYDDDEAALSIILYCIDIWRLDLLHHDDDYIMEIG